MRRLLMELDSAVSSRCRKTRFPILPSTWSNSSPFSKCKKIYKVGTRTWIRRARVHSKEPVTSIRTRKSIFVWIGSWEKSALSFCPIHSCMDLATRCRYLVHRKLVSYRKVETRSIKAVNVYVLLREWSLKYRNCRYLTDCHRDSYHSLIRWKEQQTYRRTNMARWEIALCRSDGPILLEEYDDGPHEISRDSYRDFPVQTCRPNLKL